MTLEEAHKELNKIADTLQPLPSTPSKSKNIELQNEYIDIENEAISMAQNLKQELIVLKANSEENKLEMQNLIDACDLVIKNPYKAQVNSSHYR